MPRTATAPLDLGRASRLFHALSDETRLEIVRCLAGGERCVCELTSDLEAAQSRMSFHLRALKEAGLVTDRKDGRWVYYTLNRDALEGIEALLDALSTPIAGAGSGCC